MKGQMMKVNGNAKMEKIRLAELDSLALMQ
jgi:hypothetical protein